MVTIQNSTRLQNLYLLACEHSTQTNLAQCLGIGYDELRRYFQNKHTEVSDAFARAIERQLNKPDGWMDRPNFGLALTNDEWELLVAYRAGSDRDKMYLSALSQVVHK